MSGGGLGSDSRMYLNRTLDELSSANSFGSQRHASSLPLKNEAEAYRLLARSSFDAGRLESSIKNLDFQKNGLYSSWEQINATETLSKAHLYGEKNSQRID